MRRKLPMDWELVAAYLANEGDDIQIKFFTRMLKEMRSWGTDYEIELQLAAVNSGLSDDDKELLTILSYKD